MSRDENGGEEKERGEGKERRGEERERGEGKERTGEEKERREGGSEGRGRVKV